MSVCYPYGSYNKDTPIALMILISIGLTTNVGGVSNKHLKNKFELPRFNANDFILEKPAKQTKKFLKKRL